MHITWVLHWFWFQLRLGRNRNGPMWCGRIRWLLQAGQLLHQHNLHRWELLIKNLNAGLQAFERGGYNSRCVSSSYRKSGLNASALNNRCYTAVCSYSKSYLYFLVSSQIVVCSINNPGAEIPAPAGMDGTLKCPTSFSNYCDIKKTCTYHCNKMGLVLMVNACAVEPIPSLQLV